MITIFINNNIIIFSMPPNFPRNDQFPTLFKFKYRANQLIQFHIVLICWLNDNENIIESVKLDSK